MDVLKNHLMEKELTIIFAEDHVGYRKVLVKELKDFGIRTMAEVTNGLELLQCLESQKPDVILLDLNMPKMGGNEVLPQLMKLYPKAKVIIFSFYFSGALAKDMALEGAKGFLVKGRTDGATLNKAIRAVHAGETYFHKIHPREKVVDPIYTPRQKEVVSLMLQGVTNEEIAKETGISVRGVEKHRQKIYSKIGVNKAIEFYKYALDAGLQFLRKT